MDKNSGGISWEREIPDPDQVPSQGCQCQEGKSSQVLAAKNSKDWVSGRHFWSPQAVPLKEPTYRLTYSDLLPLSCNTSIAAWKAPVVHREKLKCLTSGCAQTINPLLNPSLTELVSSALSETSSTWLTLFDRPWRFPEALPHPIYGPTQAAFP